MSEKENLCQGCENNCCKDFKLFWSREEIERLIQEYPSFHVVESGVQLIGGRERVYRVMQCDRLNEDGSCRDYPHNRPSFCETTGIQTRPAIKCKLHDLRGKKQNDQ
jgi:Fe-S-cluster containining protein